MKGSLRFEIYHEAINMLLAGVPEIDIRAYIKNRIAAESETDELHKKLYYIVLKDRYPIDMLLETFYSSEEFNKYISSSKVNRVSNLLSSEEIDALLSGFNQRESNEDDDLLDFLRTYADSFGSGNL